MAIEVIELTKEEIAARLKSLRIQAGLEAKEVAESLILQGAIKSVKSFYNWEAGRTQPDADTFLYLCNLYGVSKIMSEFGYLDKENAPGNTSEGKYTDFISLLDQLTPEQRGEVKGYIKRITEENAAAEAAKQTSHVG